jgi:hypothetical protein
VNDDDDDEDKLSGRTHEVVFGGFDQFDAQQIEVGRKRRRHYC